MTNCNFTDNSATGDGGAVYFNQPGNVTNCNFTGNNATAGSAIYLYKYSSDTLTVSNSIFLNNRANAKELHVKNENNMILITFTGNDNLLNAIYSNGDVEFTNVTYWGAKGKETIGTTTKPSRSNNETGQNIAVEIYDSNDRLVENVTLVTDNNGQVTYDFIKLNNGNYTFKAYHIEDNYYTYAKNNGTFTLNSALGDFNRLQEYINNAYPNSVLTLCHDYTFTLGSDENLTDGIVIDRPVTINGNGYTIDANGKARIFKVESNNVVLENITFKNGNPTTSSGGAVYFNQPGTVRNCNFTNNHATANGGAIYFVEGSTGNVTNCNFTNNQVTGQYSSGGAIWIYSGTVENCNFTNNTATAYGGAIRFNGEGTVTNCNFINNTAVHSGAVFFNGKGTVTNCNFTDNQANIHGGAIIFGNEGTVSNCNFTNNTAGYDCGAVYFNREGTVTNCNFTGNNANTGSAIYFYRYDSTNTLTISNSIFLNNRANAKELHVKNENNRILITFTGNDNLLNAIYSNGDVEFTNVTYWGAKGKETIGTTTKPSRSNNETGQNIAVEIYDSNDRLVENVTLVTDNNGQVTYDFIKLNNGNYTFKAYHIEDNYYTYAKNNGTFTLNSALGDFNRLQEYINNAYPNSVLTLCHDYTFTLGSDENLTDGIVIDRPVTINGNGYSIDANGKARIFKVESNNVVLENITFKNGNPTTSSGGAVYFNQPGTVRNCNFTNNHATRDYSSGGAIYMVSGTVTNCNFTNNQVTGQYSSGGAIYMISGTVTNCNFVNNSASSVGGAIYIGSGSGTVTNCNFTNHKAINGGAIFFVSTSYQGTVISCNFVNSSSSGTGGAIYFNGDCNVTKCNFTSNEARHGGGIYFNGKGNVTNCNFAGNNVSEYGGAIYSTSEGNVTNCNFTGNNANTGSAIYFWSDSSAKSVSNSCFLNNRANAETLNVIINENNITIIFTGNDNLLNAIYSKEDVAFTNVTYWGANGIANTDDTTIVRSEKVAGQNITVGVIVDDVLRLNEVNITDENGMIVLDIKAGDNYYITARHNTDSYYTGIENTISNMTYYVNVTPQTTNNQTVNLTAKSNIISEIMPGKLLFIFQSGENITANYAGNGTWWAEHTFADYGSYIINATYIGLDNVTVRPATITVNKIKTAITAKAVTATYNANKYLIITLKDANGKALVGAKVTVKLKGTKTYKTDKNGQIKISTKGLAPKKYTAKITFNGDKNYAKSAKNVKVTVKKAKTKITAKKKVTYKAKAKTKKLKITLKDNNGKPIKNAKVRLMLKKIGKGGKKNTKTKANKKIAKTNKKGKATFKIKKNKKAKYQAYVKFYTNKYYKKTIKKVKITIK